jgi:glutaredoxin-related protein
MAVYRSFTNLSRGLHEAMEHNDSIEIQRILGLIEIYNSAHEESKKYGWIGVGCITYADNALILAQTGGKGFDEYRNYGENNGPV